MKTHSQGMYDKKRLKGDQRETRTESAETKKYHRQQKAADFSCHQCDLFFPVSDRYPYSYYRAGLQ